MGGGGGGWCRWWVTMSFAEASLSDFATKSYGESWDSSCEES